MLNNNCCLLICRLGEVVREAAAGKVSTRLNWSTLCGPDTCHEGTADWECRYKLDFRAIHILARRCFARRQDGGGEGQGRYWLMVVPL
jgi:hypothetical protein